MLTFKLSFGVSEIAIEEMSWEFTLLTCIRMYSYRIQRYIGYIKMVFSGYAWVIRCSALTHFISFILESLFSFLII